MIKNIKIERMLAREGDALLESKKARILAGCGAENEAKITRPVVTARARIARTLAVAAAVALLAVGMIAALPFMLAEGEGTQDNVAAESTVQPAETQPVCIKEGEHNCIYDIPATESDGGMSSWNIYLRAPVEGSYSEDIGIDKLNEFFNESEFRVGSDDIGYAQVSEAKVRYEPSGELFSVLVSLKFGDNYYVDIIIDPKAVFEFQLNGGMPITEVEGYTVSKRIHYGAYIKETNEPIKHIGGTSIYMKKEGIAIVAHCDNKSVEFLEFVYDFLLKAEIDFEALKK